MAGPADNELLEDLLAREHRLLAAYEAALRRDAVDAGLGAVLRDHEREHVRALGEALDRAGDRDPRASVPSPDLTAALRDREAFALYAIGLEERTTAAYEQAVPRIAEQRLRQPLGSIMACGSAHVVALRDLLGRFLVN